MKIYRILMSFPFSLMLITSMLGILVFTNTQAIGASKQKADTLDSGYSALKLFLEDEQHLTTLRRVKLVLAFEGISDKSTRLVDEIADTSEQALDDLEKLAAARPAIVFRNFPMIPSARPRLIHYASRPRKNCCLTQMTSKKTCCSASQISCA